ncbi:MAG: hypothetical protein VYC34_00400, partial [Planctomycetota bacterium]|nr:hypothetical protein [Planctomycetota bacterium]
MTRRSHTKPVLIGLFFAGVAAWAALLAAGCAGSNEPRDVELADTAADDRDAAGQSESPQAAPASGASDRAMGPPAGVQSVAPTAKADAGPAEVDAAPSTTASASRSQQREAEAASD